MKVLKEFPPNFDKIKEVLNPPETACFAYGTIIYNPSGNDINGDLLIHEMTHEVQQKEMGIKKWWNKYLEDKDFRLIQEADAYGSQFSWIKSKRPEKLSRKYLELFAHQLSTLYKLDLTFNQAFTLIRLQSKNYENN